MKVLKTDRNSQGFTLIELLVVIAIIGILAAVVLIALNPVEFLRKSRDTQRLSDMESLVTATKLFLTNNPTATLPTAAVLCSPAAAATAADRAVDGTGWLTGVAINQGSTGNTLPTLPVDPSPSAVRRYAFLADANGNFEYSAVLESTSNTAKMTGDGGDDAARYEAGTTVTLDTDTCP